MPTYEYRCTACGEPTEAVQSFSDPALTVCPACGAQALRKVFGSVGVVFKGSGFYRTDSRKEGAKATAPAAAQEPAAKKSAAESGGGADKPAAPTPAKSSDSGSAGGSKKVAVGS